MIQRASRGCKTLFKDKIQKREGLQRLKKGLLKRYEIKNKRNQIYVIPQYGRQICYPINLLKRTQARSPQSKWIQNKSNTQYNLLSQIKQNMQFNQIDRLPAIHKSSSLFVDPSSRVFRSSTAKPCRESVNEQIVHVYPNMT